MKLASSLRQSLAFGALLLTAALMAFGLSSWALGSRGNSARTQPQGRKIERPKFPEEPFEITDLKVKGNKVNAGESFENSDNDWLKDIEFKFVNKFDKPIVFILLSLRFSDPGSNTRPIAYNIHIGQRPNEKSPVSGPIFLINNDFANIRLSDTEYENLKQFLSSSGITVSNLTKVRVVISTVLFSDGSEWQSGTFFEPDPSNPGKLREVKK